MPTIETFIYKMYEQLCFPITSNFTEESFVEGMTNLSWLNINNVYIIIKDFDCLFRGRKEKQALLLTWFNDIIFPYWDKKIEECGLGDVDAKVLHVFAVANNETPRVLH